MRTILSLDNDQNGDKEKIKEKRILEDTWTAATATKPLAVTFVLSTEDEGEKDKNEDEDEDEVEDKDKDEDENEDEDKVEDGRDDDDVWTAATVEASRCQQGAQPGDLLLLISY